MFELKCIRKSSTGARQLYLTPSGSLSLSIALCVCLYVFRFVFRCFNSFFLCFWTPCLKSMHAIVCLSAKRTHSLLRCCKIGEDVSVFVKWVEPKNIIYFDFSLSAPVECWIRKFTWKWCIMMMTSSIKIVCFICNGNTHTLAHIQSLACKIEHVCRVRTYKWSIAYDIWTTCGIKQKRTEREEEKDRENMVSGRMKMIIFKKFFNGHTKQIKTDEHYMMNSKN